MELYALPIFKEIRVTQNVCPTSVGHAQVSLGRVGYTVSLINYIFNQMVNFMMVPIYFSVKFKI